MLDLIEKERGEKMTAELRENEKDRLMFNYLHKCYLPDDDEFRNAFAKILGYDNWKKFFSPIARIN